MSLTPIRRPHPTSSRRLPELVPGRRAVRASFRVFAILALAAGAASAAAGGAAAPGAKPRVTVIGDSVTASFDYVPAAKRYLGEGLDLHADAVTCRRLVAASCAFRGARPASALAVIDARGHALGPVVVINVGYNDWTAVYDVDRVMRALEAAGVRTAIWVTLRETTPNYATSNRRIRGAAHRFRDLVVADWNAYSRGKEWFREDGLHLTAAGAMGLARLLRSEVLGAVD